LAAERKEKPQLDSPKNYLNNKGTTTSIAADLSLFCCVCVGGGAGPVARNRQEFLAAER
jgi:hypothetical protein